MTEMLFDQFEGFSGALRELDVRGVVMREVKEIRPSYGEKFSVTIGHVHEAALIAYHQGKMLRCVVEGEQIPSAVRRLVAQGVTVKRVSGNIT